MNFHELTGVGESLLCLHLFIETVGVVYYTG